MEGRGRQRDALCLRPARGAALIDREIARGEFWFCTYPGGLNGELFVELLRRLMHRRKKPVFLVLDGLPAHKRAIVREYVDSTADKLSLHFLPGYAPDLNPDELVWSHVRRTGAARRPLRHGEQLRDRVDAQTGALILPGALCRPYS